jgi:HK97 family phage portal protein
MASRADVRRVAALSGRRPYRRLAGGRTGGTRPRSAYAWLLADDPTVPPPLAPLPATEWDALALPPFGRGVALLANAVAATNWHAQRWDAALGVDIRLADQPMVLTSPDPLTTAWNYRWAATEDGILYGNHFALNGDLDFRTTRPGFLVPLPADDVWILQDAQNPERWQFTVAGVALTPDELFHVSYGNRSGEVLGRGVLAQYAQALGGYVAAEEHAGSYFAGGALPPAVLQSPTILTQPQADDLKSKWRSLTSLREPVILPGNVTLTPLVSNAEQAQLVESRQWNATLVAMVLGIPPWKLGLAGPTMTYQNVETADIDFIRDSADRYGRPLVEAFSKWLMPRDTSVVFDYAQRMRADQSTTMTVLSGYVSAGILTTDEARSTMGRPPLEKSTIQNETPEGTPALTPNEVTG